MPRLSAVLSTAAALGLSACLAATLASCGDSTSSSTTAPGSSATSQSSMSALDSFLSGYVTSDGAVLRRDQGNDVVSEGQAYAMLVAEEAGRTDLVKAIWSWTKDHLSVSDGLLAYHADSQGRILDRQPAADADVLTAYALLRYDGPDAATLHSDGRALASAVLRGETTTDSQGRPVLVAGPWAVKDGVVDPSYLMPAVFDELARLTGDSRWKGLAATSLGLVDGVTDHGRTLPPDWARLEGDHLVATGSGGGSGSPQYGPDAQRVPMWFATACQPEPHQLAAAWWTVLQQENRSSATALGLDGSTVDDSGSSVALLAAAASAQAAGDSNGASDLEAGATQSNQGHATYYGSAWLALWPALRDGSLAPCS